MNGWTYAYLVVGLLFLAVPAGALTFDDINLSTDKTWLTAGDGGSSTVTVVVVNTSGQVSVDFTVDSDYGSISPAQVVTDAGVTTATATFRHGTRSGTANIMATVSDEVDAPLPKPIALHIDHVKPHEVANIWYKSNATAGETTEIVVRMEDKYGNPVDSRWEKAMNRDPEKVFFMASSPTEFLDGGSLVDELWVSVDDDGNATAPLRLDTVAGENIVFIQPPKPLVSDMISITGVGGLPVNIKQEIVPSNGSVAADGKTKISLTYTLSDEYGNPAAGQGLWVNATLERLKQQDEKQNRLFTTNSVGQVMITYGPEDSVGMANIIATAAVNASVNASKDLVFTSTDPVNMLLSANPQSMSSLDVPGSGSAELRAKVVDERGNPVKGEKVTFEIASYSFAPYNQTEPPNLERGSVPVTAITNDDGYAIVKFWPGAFTIDEDALNWSNSATGTAVVQAMWSNVNREIELTWMNFPYLSVETEVSPETVAVGDTVDVTIWLKGDGWALQPDPIDVVLVIDRSGSMNWAIDGTRNGSGQRIQAAKGAAKIFVGKMNQPRDRIGLISYSKEASKDLPLETRDGSGTVVNDTIYGLTTGSSTGTRNALYVALQEMDKNKSTDTNAVKAVILMTDGEYNYYGDPLARGTGHTGTGSWTSKDYTILDLEEQNLSAYAETMDIRIYTIAFTKDIGEDSDTWETMKILANATGGKYYHANTSEELVGVYTDIAGELKTEAGVDTEMDVIFENVEVNGNPISGSSVFDYVYEDGVSTTIESWVKNGTKNDTVIPRHTRDDTLNWTVVNPHLPFDIGTVRLGQTWETTFRLTVKEEGNINVFGSGSKITFNDGLSLDLPDTFITALPLNNTGMNFSVLDITNLTFTGTEPVDEYLPVAWDLNYTGLYDVTEDVFYSNDNEYTWVRFDTLTATNQTTNGTSALDVRGLPPGEYIIRVRGSAPDTADAFAKIVQYVTAGATGDAYIRIK